MFSQKSVRAAFVVVALSASLAQGVQAAYAGPGLPPPGKNGPGLPPPGKNASKLKGVKFGPGLPPPGKNGPGLPPPGGK